MLPLRKTHAILAGLTVLGLTAPQIAHAQTFTDNFNSPDNTNITADAGYAGRQTGTPSNSPVYDTTASSGFSGGVAGADAISGGTLRMSYSNTTAFNNSVATPNESFTLTPGGTLTVSTDIINPTTGTGGSWQGIIFAPALNNNVNSGAGSGVFSIIFAPDGTYQAWSNGTQFKAATAFTTGSPTGTYHVMFDVTPNADNTADTYDVSVNGTQLFTNTRTANLVTSGYVTLIARTKGAGQYFTFDNLSVTAAPEPSAVAGMLLGALGLGGLALCARRRSAASR